MIIGDTDTVNVAAALATKDEKGLDTLMINVDAMFCLRTDSAFFQLKFRVNAKRGFTVAQC